MKQRQEIGKTDGLREREREELDIEEINKQGSRILTFLWLY